MQDMFGTKIPLDKIVWEHRGDHEWLLNLFNNKDVSYGVKKIGDTYLQRQVHSVEGKKIMRVALFDADNWEKVEKYNTEILHKPATQFID